MESYLEEIHLKWCIIHLDDIIVFSKAPEEHTERLRGVFEKLSAAGLRLKPSKCEFIKSKITYLGHIVSKDGNETEKKKITTIQEWPILKTVKLKYIASWDLRIIVINLYPNMLKLHNPINQLVSGGNAYKKKALVEWNDECQEAFNRLKQLCSQNPYFSLC